MPLEILLGFSRHILTLNAQLAELGRFILAKSSQYPWPIDSNPYDFHRTVCRMARDASVSGAELIPMLRFTQETCSEKFGAIISSFPVLTDQHPFHRDLMNILYGTTFCASRKRIWRLYYAAMGLC